MPKLLQGWGRSLWRSSGRRKVRRPVRPALAAARRRQRRAPHRATPRSWRSWKQIGHAERPFLGVGGHSIVSTAEHLPAAGRPGACAGASRLPCSASASRSRRYGSSGILITPCFGEGCGAPTWPTPARPAAAVPHDPHASPPKPGARRVARGLPVSCASASRSRPPRPPGAPSGHRTWHRSR
jgi:hypothetical protein